MAEERDIYAGIWNGKRIHFDRNFRGHRLTDEECDGICSNKEVVLTGLKSKQKNETYDAAIKLDNKKDDGECNAFITIDHFISRGIPVKFCEHTFTDDERLMLENGMTVHLDMCYSKKNLKYFDCDVKFNKRTGKIEFV